MLYCNKKQRAKRKLVVGIIRGQAVKRTHTPTMRWYHDFYDKNGDKEKSSIRTRNKINSKSHSTTLTYCFSILLVVIATGPPLAEGHYLEFSIEPIDTVVEVHNSAVLNCKINVSEPQYLSSVMIEWIDQNQQKLTFVGDQYRSQLANGSLYINSVEVDRHLTGTYQCMASVLNVGAIISRRATLQTSNIFGFYEEPRDSTVFVGQKAHFACHVNGVPAPKIRWLKNEQPLHLDQLRMVVLPSGALEIDEVLESDQGTYRCNASTLNTYKLSTKANLAVNTDPDQATEISAPNFIVQPKSSVVVQGENISLDCTANGYPTPKIIWLKDGRTIDTNYLDGRYSLIGTTNSLRITDIMEEDAGTYQCRATNTDGSVDATAFIEIQVPPQFVTKPKDCIDYVYKDVELECEAHGIPEPTFQWYKNGELITSGDYYKIIKGHNLRINGLLMTDSGLFQCFASNPAGNVQSIAQLTVLSDAQKAFNTKISNGSKKKKAPFKLDKNQSLLLFSNLQSESSARFADVDFSHMKPGGGRPNANSKNTNQNYNRNFLQDSFRGGGGGGGTDGTGFVIIDPLSAFLALNSSESDQGTSTTINHNSNNNKKKKISGGGGDGGDFLPSPNTYPIFTHHHPPNYQNKPFVPTADIWLDRDSDETSADDLPSAPYDLNAIVVKARYVILNWKVPMKNAQTVFTYMVYYRQEGSDRERIQNTTRNRPEEVNIGGLTPGRVYHFRVMAINNNGLGPPSDILTLTTQPDENVASSPQNFYAYATGPRSIRVGWEPPEFPNGNILRYTVYYMEVQSSTKYDSDTVSLRFDVGGLFIYTDYTVWVVAVNENGPGAATEEKIVRTHGAAPSEPPLNVTIEPAGTRAIVRWEPPPPETQNGIITGYKLRYRKENIRTAPTTSTVTDHNYVLENLERGTTYQVKLWTMNVNGTSPSTDWYSFKTMRNDFEESQVPEKPGSLMVRPMANKLYVLWAPPVNQKVRIRQYVLGWGKGIPDNYTMVFDEKDRHFIIDNLEANSEYVLSLSALNGVGAGAPVYATVRTQEAKIQLSPPIGLKAQVLSSTSLILYWSDRTVTKYMKDSRYYVVKYGIENSAKSRYVNTTDAYLAIDDLRPNTAYEFTVKLVKDGDESAWSMVVTNSTWEPALKEPPRDLDAHLATDSDFVELTWQAPKTTKEQRITGYVILYTDNKTSSDRESVVHAIKGDIHTAIIKNLKPFTEYYFKVQARNNRSYGPFSNIVMFRTGQIVGTSTSNTGLNYGEKGLFSSTALFYLIISGCVVAATTITLVVLVLCCRRRREAATPNTTLSPDRTKKPYQKGVQGVKQPPDLWIHHDQMELKALEKNNDGASSSGGGMTLPRPITNEYDAHDRNNSLDKRTYIPNYMSGCLAPEEKPRGTTIRLPVDCKPPREPIVTPINYHHHHHQINVEATTPSGRPAYPRTQYSTTLLQQSVSSHSPSENPYTSGCHLSTTGISSSSTKNWSGGSYSSEGSTICGRLGASSPNPGLSTLVETQKRVAQLSQQQHQNGSTNGLNHPLKSFTVPAPPPISAPGTPQSKHIVTVRPNASPYKKPPPQSCSPSGGTLLIHPHGGGATPPPSHGSSSSSSTTTQHRGHLPPHTVDEIQKLNPSHSTEELNQEMANLEGLMLTLNAITASEFEC